MLKELAINMLKTAETNLLNSFLKIRPEDIHKQVLPELNTITWIMGHCMAHFHKVLCQKCQEEVIALDDTKLHSTCGATKEIAQSDSPLTFSQIIDCFLNISDDIFSYLQSLEDVDFETIIISQYDETLLQSVQRVSLHLMCHMGQIVLVRRALANPGPTFMGGVQESQWVEMRMSWENWWTIHKDDFQI